MPRRQQSIIISDIELLSIIIAISAWGLPGEGIVHIAVTDNTNAISWMCRRRAKRGISAKLPDAFLSWDVHLRLKIVIVYSRTHRNCAADAPTRTSAGEIDELASERGVSRIEIPEVWAEFCPSVAPGDLSLYLVPIFCTPRSDV